MKRQRGRGGRKSNGQANRHFESSGPDIKIRGSATHIYEKYQQLARDAASAGDHVKAENLLQHAEHYYRVMQTMQPPQQPQQKRSESDERQQPSYSGNGHDTSGQGSDAHDPMKVVATDDSSDGQTDDRHMNGASVAQSGDDGQQPAGTEEEPAPRRTRRVRRPRKSAESDEAKGEARDALEAASSSTEAVEQPG